MSDDCNYILDMTVTSRFLRKKRQRTFLFKKNFTPHILQGNYSLTDFDGF